METFIRPSGLSELQSCFDRDRSLVCRINAELYSLKTVAGEDRLAEINHLIYKTETLMSFLSKISSATGDIENGARLLSRNISDMLDDSIYSAETVTRKAFNEMGNI